jgi:hypothetical protein
MKRTFLILLLITTGQLLLAQMREDNREKFVLKGVKITEEISIDGVIDEATWEQAEATTPFYNKWPTDSGYAAAKTEVKILFTDEFIYLSAVNYQQRNDLVIQTLKRDQQEPFWSSENFAFVLDPMNQKNTGFMFGVNAGGSQIEASINLQGAWSIANENWDNKWFSAVKVLDDRWIVEMAIPFSAIRFKKGVREWGINFVRTDMKRNVYSTWAQVPVQFNGIDLGHLGTLRFEGDLTPRQSKVTLVPYVSGSNTRNFEEGEDPKLNGNAGLDAKIGLTSSLNLDLTYRPDFSNVDVDKQVTNVTRFSIFFPERRNFFLENADLFSNFGSWLVKPFFSRKIGIQDGEAIPIHMGARITGNVTKSLRIGIMDIQTEATKNFSANNYLVASAQQRVLKRSNIKFFTGSRSTNKKVEGDATESFNRTYGGEFQFVSENGKFSSTTRAHFAETPEKLESNEYLSAGAGYNSGKMYMGAMVEKVGENYVNDFGFVPRLYNYDALNDTTIRIGHYTANPWFGLLIRPAKYGINLIEVNTWSVINYRTSGEFLERMTSVNLSVSFKNTSELFFEAFNTDTSLPVACDIIDSGTPLPVERYAFTQFTARYSSDKRKMLSGDVSFTNGYFYNGTRIEVGGSLNARFQPWGNFGVSYLQNEIKLPGEYGSASFVLIGPRAEVSFRNNIWLTTFLQYNTQADNFNVNSRLQWRFKPMSDLFIVYTDNYATTDFSVKNRGLVVKLTYWLNL